MIDDKHILRAANRTSPKTFSRERKLPNFALYPQENLTRSNRIVRVGAICNSKRKVRFPDAHQRAVGLAHAGHVSEFNTDNW